VKGKDLDQLRIFCDWTIESNKINIEISGYYDAPKPMPTPERKRATTYLLASCSTDQSAVIANAWNVF